MLKTQQLDRAGTSIEECSAPIASGEEMGHIVNDVWFSMTGISLQCDPSLLTLCKTRGYAVASIEIIGELNYVLRLEMEMGLLVEAASQLLQVDGAMLTSEEISDAAGELANVIGGSLKRVWSKESRLSLPVVVVGMDFNFLIPDSIRAAECSYASPGGCMNVVLLRPR